MNEINLGQSGPIMSGTWWNPETGDTFTVKDSFFENGQYTVLTTDNRVLGYNMIQNYVQSNRKEDVTDGKTPSYLSGPAVKNIVKNTIPDSVMNEISPLESLSDLYNDNMIIEEKPIMKEVNDNIKDSDIIIIEKVLGKKPGPVLDVNIKWSDYPGDVINLMTDTMEIPKEKVIDWYISKTDIETIKKSIADGLKKFFNKKIDINVSVVKKENTKKVKNDRKG